MFITELFLIASVVPALIGALVAGDFFQYLYKPSRRSVFWVLSNRIYLVTASVVFWTAGLLSHLFLSPTWFYLLVGVLLLDLLLLISGFLVATYIMFPKLRNPDWMSPDEADEYLSSEDNVIGVEVNDDARAFPVDWTFRPHIVEDQIGGESVSMTFCMLSNLGMAYKNELDGDPMEFIMPIQWENNMMMYDVRSQRLIQQVEGTVLEGDNEGERLERYPTVIMSWSGWNNLHPDTKVLDNRPSGVFDRVVRYVVKRFFMEPNFESPEPAFPTIEHEDDRLPNKAEVFGLSSDEHASAYPVDHIESERIYNDSFQGDPIVFVADPDRGINAVYSRRPDSRTLTFVSSQRDDNWCMMDQETESLWDLGGTCFEGKFEGQQLEEYPHTSRVLWFVWVNFYPETNVKTPSDDRDADGSKQA